MQIALEHTHSVVWIRATKTTRWARQNQLIGFARATSDGHLTATIWDVAVNPSWQRIGLGRGLMERIVIILHAAEIPMIALFAEPAVVGLYAKLGFKNDAQDVKGMAFITKSAEGRALVASAAVPVS